METEIAVALDYLDSSAERPTRRNRVALRSNLAWRDLNKFSLLSERTDFAKCDRRCVVVTFADALSRRPPYVRAKLLESKFFFFFCFSRDRRKTSPILTLLRRVGHLIRKLSFFLSPSVSLALRV